MSIIIYILLAFFAHTLLLTNSMDIYLYSTIDEDPAKVGLPLTDPAAIVDLPGYNYSLPNIMLTHGYNGSRNGGCMMLLIGAVLKSVTKRNVFFVDWSKEAAAGLGGVVTYPKAVANSLEQGAILGKALYDSSTTNRFDLKNTTGFGFSLGCSLWGAAGREVNSHGISIARISCCDSAKPLSGLYPGLDKTCADLVIFDNTDPNNGEYKAKGKANFWPNYGRIATVGLQPGCSRRDPFEPLNPNSLCSHNRCVQLWATSVNPCLKTDRAANYSEWVAGRITGTSCFGDQADKTVEGNYYFNTTDCPPYQPVDRDADYPVPTGTLTENCQSFCPSQEL